MLLMENAKKKLDASINELCKYNDALGRHIAQLQGLSKDIDVLMKNSTHSSCEKVLSTMSSSISKLQQARLNVSSSISAIKNWISVSFSTQAVDFGCGADNCSARKDIKSTLLSCQVGEYYYEMGENNSRHAFGQLKHIEKIDRKRDSNAQKNAGGNRRRADDDGGHLIGARFGGARTSENLFPQNRHLNRSAYKTLEKEWEVLLDQGNQVYVDIYTSASNDETREDSIYGSYIVIRSDGTSYTEAFSFANEDKKTQTDWDLELNQYDVF